MYLQSSFPLRLADFRQELELFLARESGGLLPNKALEQATEAIDMMLKEFEHEGRNRWISADYADARETPPTD